MSGVTRARWLMPRQRGFSDAGTMASPFGGGREGPLVTIPRRRDARAAESDGLENHCASGHRGFKSHSLRHRTRPRVSPFDLSRKTNNDVASESVQTEG